MVYAGRKKRILMQKIPIYLYLKTFSTLEKKSWKSKMSFPLIMTIVA